MLMIHLQKPIKIRTKNKHKVMYTDDNDDGINNDDYLDDASMNCDKIVG